MHPALHVAVLVGQLGAAAQPTTPDAVNWRAVDQLLEINPNLGVATGFRKFDLPPPSFWPAPLNDVWNDGNAECAVVALASSARVSVSARCCGIRLAYALRHRVERWKGGRPTVSGIHEGDRPLSTVAPQSPLRPKRSARPLSVQERCDALPSALQLGSDDLFSRALVERWATVAGKAPARACTLRTLLHREPKESAGVELAGEEVASSILDCGATIAADEVATNELTGGATVAVDRLLSSFAAAVCSGAKPPSRPTPPEPLPEEATPKAILSPGTVPATLTLSASCSGLPAVLEFEGHASFKDALSQRWADAHGTGPKETCTVSEQVRVEAIPSLGSATVDVIRTVLRCGSLVLANDVISLGSRSRVAVDDLLQRYAAARCEALERARAARPGAPKVKGKKRP